MNYILIWTLSLLLLLSCSQKTAKQNQVKKSITSNEVSEQEFNITARFNWYEMKHDTPYSLIFEIDSGGIIYFEDCEINHFDFIVKLNESETNDSNAGWGINDNLSLQEFNITYTNRRLPNYLNDSIPLYVIQKIALDTMVIHSATDSKNEAPDNTIKKNDTNGIAKDEFTVRAKFTEFVLGDAVHIYFEDESGQIISFDGSIPFDFGIVLAIDDPALNYENQGWVADPEILGKWFTLTYFEEEREMYIDGPMGIVSIIKTAVLDEEKVKTPTPIKTPVSFRILEELEGDLDNDGVSEKVIVYDTENEIDLGTKRKICIYKNNNNTWEIWKTSISAILGSEQGGMMGDPFEGISIEKNCIVIKHFGGSRSKWEYVHSYTYQNGDFRLIAVKVISITPCEEFELFEYKLSSGEIKYEIEIEDCDKETSKIEKKEMIRKLETLPSMDGFSPGSKKVTFPNSEITIYY
jgi:hypothetical protein